MTLLTFVVGSLVAMAVPAFFPRALTPPSEEIPEASSESLPIEFAVLRIIDTSGDRADRTLRGRQDLQGALVRIADLMDRGASADAVVAAAVERTAATKVKVSRLLPPAVNSESEGRDSDLAPLEYIVLGPRDVAPGSLETVFVRLRGGDSRTVIVASVGENRFAATIACAALARDVAPAVIVLGDDEVTG